MNPSRDPVQQLADYFKKNLSKGYTPDSLKYSLMSQGYSKISVEKALSLANKQLASLAPKMREKPQITYRFIKGGQVNQQELRDISSSKENKNEFDEPITDNVVQVGESDKQGFFKRVFDFFTKNNLD